MNDVKIVGYNPEYAAHFKSLNVEWLEKFFVVEQVDLPVLDNPYDELIRPGGEVIFAQHGKNVIGTCALKKHSDDAYELTKMAVTARAQGLQVGKKLGLAIIEKARNKGAGVLFLESNRILLPALSLYNKLGFVEKELPFEKSVYSRSDIYMELLL